MPVAPDEIVAFEETAEHDGMHRPDPRVQYVIAGQ